MNGMRSAVRKHGKSPNLYTKFRVGEFLLLLISVWAVSVVALNAFYLDGVTEALGWWGRAGVCLCVVAPLLTMLYAASASRRNAIAGVLFYVAFALVLLMGALLLSTGENIYEDAEGNYLYMAAVLVGFATVGFLLTRTLAGSAIWFVSVAFCCSVVQAFYQTEELGMSVAASMTALTLIVYKNFTLGLKKADTVTVPSAAGGFATSIAPVACVFGVSLAVWFFVIAPLCPGVLDITLRTDYRSLPVEYLKGAASEKPELDLSMTSDTLIDGFYYTTDDLKEDPSSTVVVDAASLLEQRAQQQVSGEMESEESESGDGTRDSLDEDSLDEEYDPVSYSTQFPWVIIGIIAAVLVVGGVVGYFVGRRAWRTHRLRGMLALEPVEQVKRLYRFELDRLGRLGFSVPEGMTLTEFSAASARSMDIILEETRVSFDKLTEQYCACTYGKHVPTEDEVVPFAAWYLRFWKAARSHLGNFKYFFKSFRL